MAQALLAPVLVVLRPNAAASHLTVGLYAEGGTPLSSWQEPSDRDAGTLGPTARQLSG